MRQHGSYPVGKHARRRSRLGDERTHLLPIMAICISLAFAAAFADTPREQQRTRVRLMVGETLAIDTTSIAVGVRQPDGL